ncbi:uncharacterized protein K452DRAFT_291843 [Aplosporella prunicola CBS 121167]|uniref:Uncharacterized protein n=1 Tax=Aplosporella prunicola CBS 121167 TaxID=1176127 RepID=A0A6A6AZH2_9PEZI|nr:uncharacterized protein K452DRAFT_291843 [Aplosporella prunicola CBS 121167]KAF2137180.1 hypothetical protein K452DRAFT_291843 [Aplosporella prunicola CBS 121167]
MRTASAPPMAPRSAPGTASTVPQLQPPAAAPSTQPQMPAAANTIREAVQQTFPSKLVFPSIQNSIYGYPRIDVSVPMSTFSSHGRYVPNMSGFGAGPPGPGYETGMQLPGQLSMENRSLSLPLAFQGSLTPPGMPTENVAGQTTAPVQSTAAVRPPMNMQNFRHHGPIDSNLILPSNVANELRDIFTSDEVTPRYTGTFQKDKSAAPSVNHTEGITNFSGTPNALSLDQSTSHGPGNIANTAQVGPGEDQPNESNPAAQKKPKSAGSQKRYQWVKGGRGGGHYINPETGETLSKEEAAARGAKPRGLTRPRDKKGARTDTGDGNKQTTTAPGAENEEAQMAGTGNQTQHALQDRFSRARSTASLESQPLDESSTIISGSALSRAESPKLQSSHGNPTSTPAATDTTTTPTLSTASNTRSNATVGARRRERAKERAV